MVFPGGTLGSDEVSIAALQAGTLEMASLNSGILANQVKAFAVFDLPLLLSGDGEADALLDGPSGGRCTTPCTTRGWSAWPITSWVFGRSPTACGRSTPSPTSRA
jgi:TRAP-type C4-dicarboxylate transport system substrate-binding protein